jgi:hypothetical protein
MLKRFFSIILLLSVFSACKYESESFGDFEKVFVFSDSLMFSKVQTELEQVFDHYVYTPHSEKTFYLEYQSLNALRTYQKRRNIMFLVLLDGKDEVSKYIDQILTPQVKAAVAEGKVFYIFKENLFTQDQMGIILVARDVATMQQNLVAYGDDIFNQLDDYHFRRLERIMFLRGEQTALEEYFLNNLGWKIRVQHDYYIVKESEDGNFVWLRRFKPDRNLFVYRFKGDSSMLNEEYVTNVRDSLSKIYFEGDSVSAEDTYAVSDMFKGKPALTMIGVWQNHQHYLGGPFKSYTFYDKNSAYIYMIDMMVTAPGKRKKPFLDQLDTMARTFTLKSEI